MTTLSRREKVLASLVGGIVAVMLNLFLISFFLQNQARLRGELARREAELKGLQTVLAERPVTEERAAWLKSKQPRLDVDETRAGFQLLDRIKEAAQKHVVKPGRQEPRKGEARAHYISLPVDIEARGAWPALVKFMHELQGPEQFVAFEKANLQVDKEEPTQMQATFRVARWYAPK